MGGVPLSLPLPPPPPPQPPNHPIPWGTPPPPQHCIVSGWEWLLTPPSPPSGKGDMEGGTPTPSHPQIGGLRLAPPTPWHTVRHTALHLLLLLRLGGGLPTAGMGGGQDPPLLLLAPPFGHLVVDGHLLEAAGLQVRRHLFQRLWDIKGCWGGGGTSPPPNPPQTPQMPPPPSTPPHHADPKALHESTQVAVGLQAPRSEDAVLIQHIKHEEIHKGEL